MGPRVRIRVTDSTGSAGARRWRAVLLATFVSAVTLEAALQATAVALWLRHGRADLAALGSGSSTILCVGDSYTFGLGATTPAHAYPSVLETLLHQSDTSLTVVNGGWPGRNSRDVLIALREQLDRSHPALVYVLVGVNDGWSRPDLLEETAVGHDNRFQWRWRTRRLAMLGVSAIRALPSFLRRRDDNGSMGEVAKADVTDRKEAPQVPRNWERAQSLAESTWAHKRLGRQPEARETLARLRAEFEASGRSESIGELFVEVAEEAGETELARREALELSGAYPANPAFPRVVAWQSYQRGELATAVEAIDRAVVLSSADPDAGTFRLRALITRNVDPRKSLCSALQSYRVDGDRALLRQLLTNGGPVYTHALLDECLSEQGFADGERSLIAQVLADSQHPSDSAATATFVAHLRLAVRWVRAAGGEAVFLGYPFHSTVNTAARSVANETGAGWIDVPAVFARRLASDRREDLFVADGHLNDRGYAILADLVATDARFRLLRGPVPEYPAPMWILAVQGEGNAATLRYVDDTSRRMRVIIERSATPTVWHVQLRQHGFALAEGASYELRFRIRADSPRMIAVGVNDRSYRNVGLYREVPIAKAWEERRWAFVARTSDSDAMVHFNLGGSQVSVDIADVELRRLPDLTLVKPTGADGSLPQAPSRR